MELSPGDYLRQQLLNHIGQHFIPEAYHTVEQTDICFAPYSECQQVRGRRIAIPTDIPASIIPSDPFKVPFGKTELTFWNRIEPPSGPGWQPATDSAVPLWYRHESGSLIPSAIVCLYRSDPGGAIVQKKLGNAQLSSMAKLSVSCMES